MIDREELFERWLGSLDIPLVAWQKELLRVWCTQPDGRIYISMPRHNGRQLVYKLIEQFEQMIKEKEMQHKMKEFDMKDVHSGYVVKFRNGNTALVMRVGAKFTKIFACTQFVGITKDVKEGTDFFYTSSYKGPYHYAFDPICSRTKPDPDHDVVAVYGLVEGVNNYLEVGAPLIGNRPLIWGENIKEMTLEEVEKALGHKVKIVNKEGDCKESGPIKTKELCKECKYYTINSGCRGRSCDECNMYSKRFRNCRCNKIVDGEPCPYFVKEEG